MGPLFSRQKANDLAIQQALFSSGKSVHNPKEWIITKCSWKNISYNDKIPYCRILANHDRVSDMNIDMNHLHEIVARISLML